MMAKTTHSTTNQNTLGSVPIATEPTDPVPLQQAGGGSDTIWATNAVYYPQVSVSVEKQWGWNAQELKPIGQLQVLQVPFEMRLKEVAWYPQDHNITLNIYRNHTIVGTAGRNRISKYNLRYQAGNLCYFQTSSYIRLATWVTLALQWEIQRDISPVQSDSQAAAADIMAGLQDIEAEGNQQTQSQLAAPSVEPVEPRKTNRFVTWIKNRWR